MVKNKIQARYQSLPIQVKASFWFLICSFLQHGIAVITTPIFTRLMSTADYGQFGVFNSWYEIISIIVGFSLTAGIHVQGLVKFDTDRRVFSSSLQGLSVTLIFIWCTVYFVFKDFWNQLFSLSTIQMVCMFVIIWSTAVFGFWANEQRTRYAYRMLVIVTIIYSLISPVLQIMLVLHLEDKCTARIIGWAVSCLVIFSWMFFQQLWQGKVFFSEKYWRYALTFNLLLIPHYLSQKVLNCADRIMIQRMIGDSEAGIYNLAYSLALVMAVFNHSLMQALSPWIYQKIKDKQETDIASIAYYTMILIAGVNLLLILLAPEVVAFFAPKEYYDAIWVIPPVAMSVFFMYVYDFYAKFAFYYEKTAEIMIASISGAVLNMIMNYFFIGKYGYIAAGYTTLLCYMIYAGAHYLFMRKVCRDCCAGRYPLETKKIVLITVPFLILGFLFMLIYRLVIIRCVIIGIGIIAVYFYRQKTLQMINILSNNYFGSR